VQSEKNLGAGAVLPPGASSRLTLGLQGSNDIDPTCANFDGAIESIRNIGWELLPSRARGSNPPPGYAPSEFPCVPYNGYQCVAFVRFEKGASSVRLTQGG